MENTRQKIDSILRGEDYSVEPIGDLWKIRVGEHGGAWKDGPALAGFLLSKQNKGKTRIAHPEPESVTGEEMRGAAAEVELQTPPPTPEVVEKVIENPETQERLAEALRKLDEANAKLAEKKSESPVGYKFNVSALQSEQRNGETLADTDERLTAELADLEARLSTVSEDGLKRHTWLSGKLFKKVT